jgi:hypothetical protein
VRRLSLAVAAAGVIASSGCARNAFLELSITMPANGTKVAQLYAVTQVMAGATDFKIQWGGDNPIAPVLLSATPQVQKLSIEGNNDNETTEIRVKVTFCKEPNCVGSNDDKAPAAALQIERAFYIGKRTTYTWKLDCVPAGGPDVQYEAGKTCAVVDKEPDVVTKCEVGGCRPGTTSNYCSGGKHFCEDD